MARDLERFETKKKSLADKKLLLTLNSYSILLIYFNLEKNETIALKWKKFAK